jgi:hypothetical protein
LSISRGTRIPKDAALVVSLLSFAVSGQKKSK